MRACVTVELAASLWRYSRSLALNVANAVAIRELGGVDVLEALKTGGTEAQKPYAAGALQALEVRSCTYGQIRARTITPAHGHTMAQLRSREHSPFVCAAGMRSSDCRGTAC